MEFIPENFPTPDEPIRFGNPKGDYQLLVACSPFCTPCSKAHKVIEELYNKYPDKIGISIRFAIGTADMQDVRAVAVTEILKAAFHSPYEAVRDWYNDMSLEKFEQLYKSDPLDVSHIITQHIQWARNANITATPTIFLNGRKLPEIYNWMELAVAIEYELKSY